MKIGLVSYQGSGKSTLFEWLTQIKPDPALAHSSQSAMAVIPDHRVEPLCEIYQPKKITLAQLELVDTPGLSRMHEGNGNIRQLQLNKVIEGHLDPDLRTKPHPHSQDPLHST